MRPALRLILFSRAKAQPTAPPGGGGGGGGGTWNPAVTHALVTLSGGNLTAVRAGAGSNSRVLSTVKCAQGNQCRFEFTPNFSGGSETVAVGVGLASSADDWIGQGAVGSAYQGSVIYDDAVTYFDGGNQSNPSFGNMVSGTPVGIEIDNSTPASPVAWFVKIDGTRIGPFALPASNDFYGFQSCDSGATAGNGGTANFGPTWATPATGGYGQMS